VSLPAAEYIGSYAFYCCFSLVSVSLPVATEIGQYAFYFTSLTSVSLPVATEIGQYAFYYTSLTSVSLPVAASIGNYAFAYTGSAALTITLGTTAPRVGTAMFDGVFAKPVTVKVPTSVPSAGSGYGTIPQTYTTDTATQNWANAFRGMGRDSTGGYGSGTVNSGITLDIRYITP
jgi:hypothetical protein